MIVHDRWGSLGLRIADDRSWSLGIAEHLTRCFHMIVCDRYKSSAIPSDRQRSWTIIWKPVFMGHLDRRGSFAIAGVFPLNFQDRRRSLRIVCDRWNRTHFYSSDPQRSDRRRSLGIAGHLTRCFHMIICNRYKSSAIPSDCERSYGNQA